MSRPYNSHPEKDRGAVRLTSIPSPEAKSSILDSIVIKLEEDPSRRQPIGNTGAAGSKDGIMKHAFTNLKRRDAPDQMSVSAPTSKIDPATMSGNAKIAALMSEVSTRPRGALHSFTLPPAPPHPELPPGLHGLLGMNLPLGEAAGDGTHRRRYARSLPPQAPAVAGASGNRGHQATDVSLLSRECQKRGFNPHFHEWVTASGNFMCSVDIRGQMVSGIEEYSSLVKAKNGIAKRALSIVKGMPCIPRDDSKPRYGGVPDYLRWDRRNTESHYSPDYPRSDEQRSLIERIISFNPSNSPSEHILANPAACQAYLAGFAVGTRMAEALNRPAQDQDRGRAAKRSTERPAERFWREGEARRREKTPASTAYGRLRERSPLRRRDDARERSTQERSRGRRGRSVEPVAPRNRDAFKGK
ncbi:hypothetical protein F4776DRAFT_658641 [Hypoxylon sp. NC0597]|nr:hypothetical protein F4776DRAFT_658641 [Hypoxylon sp. NC0597]